MIKKEPKVYNRKTSKQNNTKTIDTVARLQKVNLTMGSHRHTICYKWMNNRFSVRFRVIIGCKVEKRSVSSLRLPVLLNRSNLID